MNIYTNTNDINKAVEQFRQLLLQAKDKGVTNVVYSAPKQVKPNRSQQQNAYLWGVVYKSILDHFIATGIYEYSSEDLHEFLKARFLTHKGKVLDDGENIMVVGVRSNNLDKEEFTNYIQLIKAWAMDKLGIQIPDSNER